MKLYIWRYAYQHVPYGGGIAFALAENADQARALIRADAANDYRTPNLLDEPECHTAPTGEAYSWAE